MPSENAAGNARGPRAIDTAGGETSVCSGTGPIPFSIPIREMRNGSRQRVSVSSPDTPALRLILFPRSESDPPPEFLAISVRAASSPRGPGTAGAGEQQPIPARGPSCVTRAYEA